jgi:hypothetical protein
MPDVAWPPLAVPQLFREFRTEFQSLLTHHLIADDHPTRGQPLLNIPEAETAAVIQPHGVANDLGRKTVILIEGRDWLCVHAAITSLRLTLDKPLNNLTMLLCMCGEFARFISSNARVIHDPRLVHRPGGGAVHQAAVIPQDRVTRLPLVIINAGRPARGIHQLLK